MQVADRNSYFSSLLKTFFIQENGDEFYRCPPPHLDSSSIRNVSRCFGGTIIGGAFQVAKLEQKRNKIDGSFNSVHVLFCAPANSHFPIDFYSSFKSDFLILIEAKQNNRVLSRIIVKQSMHLKDLNIFVKKIDKKSKSIDSPHQYLLPDLFLISKMDLYAWFQHKCAHFSPLDCRLVEYGSTYNDEPYSIFWVQIPLHQREKCAGIDAESFVAYLSDYYIIQAVSNHLRKNGAYFKNIASLEHNLTMTQTEKFNPFQWFLIYSNLETLQNDISTVRIVIFSEAKTPLACALQTIYTPMKMGTPKLKIDSLPSEKSKI